MNIPAPIKNWFAGFLPALARTPPREWLRASCGALAGLTLCLALNLHLFPEQMLHPLFGPFAATAVLLFAVPSGALAQPWSVLVSYLVCCSLTLVIGGQLGYSLPTACLAVALSLLAMSALRCLHPPAGAAALCVHLSGSIAEQQGFTLLLPIMSAVGTLLACALILNNLMGIAYPKRAERQDRHRTADIDPHQRIGISEEDLDRALSEFGEVVDITRDDLGRLIRLTEQYTIKRGLGDMRAHQLMSRDLRTISPDASREQAMELLRKHRIRSLPVLDKQRKLVGIVSLVDLISRAHGVSPFTPWNLARGVKVNDLMTSPVLCVNSQDHVVELIPKLSSHGLHCLPVVEGGELVGIITQTDLIAALQRNLLERMG